MRRARCRGYLLISVSIALFVIAAIALALNEESLVQTHRLDSQLQEQQLQQLLEAGMQQAEWQLRQQACGPFTDLPQQRLGNGQYSASVSTNNAGALTQTFRVEVSDDSTIDDNSPDSGFGNDSQLLTKLSVFPSAKQHALLRYDLAAAGVPAGAQILSATAYFYLQSNSGIRPTDIHRVTTDWSESSVTWNSFNGSYDPAVEASLPDGLAENAYASANLTSLVQSWVNGSLPNQGIVLIPDASLYASRSFSSKEAGSTQAPYLEVVVSENLMTRADIRVQAQLDNGVAGQLERTNIPLLQPYQSLNLQPGPDSGKDGWVTSDQPDDNYGVTGEMVVDGSNVQKHFIGRFDLSDIPHGARIISARLELYLGYIANHDSRAGFSLHAMRQAWSEGTGDYWNPGDGVSWNSSDGSSTWSWDDNHWSEQSYAWSPVNPAFVGWQQWDASALVQQWVNGEIENNGFIIKGNAHTVGAGFYSSDYKLDPSLRPRLVIVYACDCGTVCQAPKGSGRILFLMPDPGAPGNGDYVKLRLFESWGYQVNRLSENASASELAAAIADNDVVFLSASNRSSSLGSSLAGKSIPIVNENSRYLSDLGLATSSTTGSGDSLNVVDNSHYITAPFASGLLPFYRYPMGQTALDGSLATGGQELARVGSAVGLGVVERGALLADGSSTAAGGRVQLPLGQDGAMDWRYLNNNGRLLVQRSLQWAIDYAPAPPPPKKIYWTDDQGEVIQRSDEDGSHVETVIAAQPKVRGLDIDTVNGKIYWTTGTQIRRADLDGSNIETLVNNLFATHFDIKLDVAGGKMYWSHDNFYNDIKRANLDGSNPETINASVQQPAYLSLDRSNGQLYVNSFLTGEVLRMEFDGSGQTTLVDGAETGIVGTALDLQQGRIFWSGGSSNDGIRRANLDGSNVETLLTGLNAPQDIAYDADNDRIYWTEALVDPVVKRANADGSGVETLVTGLIRPRGIVIVDADKVPAVQPFICYGNYLDRFDSGGYGDSDGSLAWKGDWIEINESDGPGAGDEQIRNDGSRSSLRLRDNDGGGEGVERAFDLSGASSATLQLLFRRNRLDNSDDRVTLLISSNGASGPWTELAVFAGGATDSDYIPFSADISAHIGSDMRIRLLTSSSMGSLDEVYFDDLQITCSP